MSTVGSTDEQLLDEGISALFAALGVTKAVRFLNLLRPPTGDYTAERTQLSGQAALDHLSREIEALQRKEAEAAAREPAAV